MMLELKRDFLDELRADFCSDSRNILAQNLASKSDPVEACFMRSNLENSGMHVFNHRVPEEGKPVSDQKSSGRCWAFAALNAMRVPFMKEYNLEEFEFSQGFLFYHDKIERSNFFLNTIVEVGKRSPKEEPSGRLISFLLTAPLSDGGQWHMLLSLIEKYGVVPKKSFPETFSSENSSKVNDILHSKLREYARDLLRLIEAGASDEDLQLKIREQMKVVHRIVGICLSIPPESITWEYYDKAKNYKKIGPLSPLEFYQKHVKPVWDVSQLVCLVSDPRPENEIKRAYTIDCLGNVVGGTPVIYNNQPIDTLIDIAAKTLKAGKPIWFGCDVHKQASLRKGIMDVNALDDELFFRTNIYQGMDKADRLRFGDSSMCHAMSLTGVHLDENDAPVRWRVENSWGKENCMEGYLTMTTEWFRQHGFEVVVPKEFVPDEIVEVSKMTPIVLPAWDPMGILA